MIFSYVNRVDKNLKWNLRGQNCTWFFPNCTLFCCFPSKFTKDVRQITPLVFSGLFCSPIILYLLTVTRIQWRSEGRAGVATSLLVYYVPLVFPVFWLMCSNLWSPQKEIYKKKYLVQYRASTLSFGTRCLLERNFLGQQSMNIIYVSWTLFYCHRDCQRFSRFGDETFFSIL